MSVESKETNKHTVCNLKSRQDRNDNDNSSADNHRKKDFKNLITNASLLTNGGGVGYIPIIKKNISQK